MGSGIDEGDWITVDGDSGSLYAGDVTVRGERQSVEEVRLREWAMELSSTTKQRAIGHNASPSRGQH